METSSVNDRELESYCERENVTDQIYESGLVEMVALSNIIIYKLANIVHKYRKTIDYLNEFY